MSVANHEPLAPRTVSRLRSHRRRACQPGSTAHATAATGRRSGGAACQRSAWGQRGRAGEGRGSGDAAGRLSVPAEGTSEHQTFPKRRVRSSTHKDRPKLTSTPSLATQPPPAHTHTHTHTHLHPPAPLSTAYARTWLPCLTASATNSTWRRTSSTDMGSSRMTRHMGAKNSNFWARLMPRHSSLSRGCTMLCSWGWVGWGEGEGRWGGTCCLGCEEGRGGRGGGGAGCAWGGLAPCALAPAPTCCPVLWRPAPVHPGSSPSAPARPPPCSGWRAAGQAGPVVAGEDGRYGGRGAGAGRVTGVDGRDLVAPQEGLIGQSRSRRPPVQLTQALRQTGPRGCCHHQAPPTPHALPLPLPLAPRTPQPPLPPAPAPAWVCP